MIKTFDPPRTVVRRLVEDALTEDLGLLGDITTIACIVEDHTAVAAFVSREEGVLAGARRTLSQAATMVSDETIVAVATLIIRVLAANSTCSDAR